MKIKILKDIPGYKTGTEIGSSTTTTYKLFWGKNEFVIEDLINEGFAKEIKDDIDIEAIRIFYHSGGTKNKTMPLLLDNEEREFFNSYRIVKAVIDQLNGDWKPGWNDEDEEKYYIHYVYISKKKFNIDSNEIFQISILPYCKNYEIAQKVIELCEPELKVLFGIIHD